VRHFVHMYKIGQLGAEEALRAIDDLGKTMS
jgi:hypothetical protein